MEYTSGPPPAVGGEPAPTLYSLWHTQTAGTTHTPFLPQTPFSSTVAITDVGEVGGSHALGGGGGLAAEHFADAASNINIRHDGVMFLPPQHPSSHPGGGGGDAALDTRNPRDEFLSVRGRGSGGRMPRDGGGVGGGGGAGGRGDGGLDVDAIARKYDILIPASSDLTIDPLYSLLGELMHISVD